MFRSVLVIAFGLCASSGCRRSSEEGLVRADLPASTDAAITPNAAPSPSIPTGARRVAVVRSLRARIDDPSATPRSRAEARVELVTLWLARETEADVRPACLPPAAPDAGRAKPREFAMPPSLAAREEARAELRCAERAGLDVAPLQGRLDALVKAESEACAGRGQRPMEGNVFGLMGLHAPADPCEPAASDGAFGPVVHAIDTRLGVEAPAQAALGGGWGALGARDAGR